MGPNVAVMSHIMTLGCCNVGSLGETALLDLEF